MAMQRLTALLAKHSLKPLGTCEPDDYQGTMVLIGPDEPAFWDHLSKEPEHTDGQSDPMDRWSKRVLEDVADQVDGQPFFPFGGPPFHPFFTWALMTGRFWASPINFLVHETEGLFVSFRGAILLPQDVNDETVTPSPCSTCVGQPCKSACPVDAFASGYNVDACKSYLASPDGTDCMTNGCAARRACPVGQGKRQPAQAAFHMKAFL